MADVVGAVLCLRKATIFIRMPHYN